MVDTLKLKGAIVTAGHTQESVAKAIGMTPKTFYLRMKNGVFGSDEIEKMIELLDITDPMPIFFPGK
jgi:DNA-binding XRE family transcriptional regulator